MRTGGAAHRQGGILSEQNTAGSTITVEIWRGREDGHFDSFSVPHEEKQTILDVVTYIQRRLDPTVSYRFACRIGMCGSCAMMVNGAPRWTCRTHASKVVKDGKIRLQPLRNLYCLSPFARSGGT